MLPLDPGSLAVIHPNKLQLGQFFYLRMNGNFRLSVALEPNGDLPVWLNLTGKTAFSLQTADRIASVPKVLALPFAPGSISLRIDEGSAVGDLDHNDGRLFASVENGACIACHWPELEGQGYRHVLDLGSWKLTRIDEPRFAFDRWALSVVDPAGQWVDLIKREPPSGKA